MKLKLGNIGGIGVLMSVTAIAYLGANTVHAAADGATVKKVLQADQTSVNLLRADRWHPWGKGFKRQGDLFVCDNGTSRSAQRGASQSVVLHQKTPQPIVASAWSRADHVQGGPDSNYSLYLDLTYTDGSHLWGQSAPFDSGTHTWQERRVVIVPEKPIATVSVNLLLRGHAGKAWFRSPQLHVQQAPRGATYFDGVPVALSGTPYAGFQLRDVAANSDYVAIAKKALGIRLETKIVRQADATYFDVVLHEQTGKDRAVCLVYTVPVPPAQLLWLDDPRNATAATERREFANTSRFRAGSNGRLSRYPLGAVATPDVGVGLGIDMTRPAFFRIGYNADMGELFLAYDIGLTPEKPTAHIRFCRFRFDPKWRFRAALEQYYKLFPKAFVCRTTKQGLWMPFARISRVERWQDFGFQFKEGTNETAWDDAHGITTFRYTEPMTWWMRMPKKMPRTMEQATRYARQLARQKKNKSALAWLTSGFFDEQGRFVARLRDEPWCDGAVWSMNSMPGIKGAVTDFKLKWNPDIRNRYYGPQRKADLDGEYIDSSEGYVAAQLDFRREHFAAASTPLCFATSSKKPAIFRGLIAFEYIRGIADDIHKMKHLMMANSTPTRLCWFVPLLDVLGTETNWNPGGKWRPMSDRELMYRRVLCKAKPYCFLMNTHFEQFSYALVEKYMKRALAYGMFPGFFSHNAAQGHYFTRPALYNRDRPLFKKYVPLCRRVAEAGWQPIPHATCDVAAIRIERFGDRYFTVFNDSSTAREVVVRFEQPLPSECRELVSGRSLSCHSRTVRLTLGAEDVAVLDLGT